MKITINQKVKSRSKYDIEPVNLVKDRLAGFVPYWKSQTKESSKGVTEYEFISCDFSLYSGDSKLIERIKSLNESYSDYGIVVSTSR